MPAPSVERTKTEPEQPVEKGGWLQFAMRMATESSEPKNRKAKTPSPESSSEDTDEEQGSEENSTEETLSESSGSSEGASSESSQQEEDESDSSEEAVKESQRKSKSKSRTKKAEVVKPQQEMKKSKKRTAKGEDDARPKKKQEQNQEEVAESPSLQVIVAYLKKIDKRMGQLKAKHEELVADHNSFKSNASEALKSFAKQLADLNATSQVKISKVESQIASVARAEVNPAVLTNGPIAAATSSYVPPNRRSQQNMFGTIGDHLPAKAED